jgi:hypothetical protein
VLGQPHGFARRHVGFLRQLVVPAPQLLGDGQLRFRLGQLALREPLSAGRPRQVDRPPRAQQRERRLQVRAAAEGERALRGRLVLHLARLHAALRLVVHRVLRDEPRPGAHDSRVRLRGHDQPERGQRRRGLHVEALRVGQLGQVLRAALRRDGPQHVRGVHRAQRLRVRQLVELQLHARPPLAALHFGLAQRAAGRDRADHVHLGARSLAVRDRERAPGIHFRSGCDARAEREHE